MTDVKVEKKGNVAVITIEHMQAMNALSTDMYTQLEEAFDTVAAMEDAYCVVLTGSSRVNKKGKTVQSFVAGADISQMSTMTVPTVSAGRSRTSSVRLSLLSTASAWAAA